MSPDLRGQAMTIDNGILRGRPLDERQEFERNWCDRCLEKETDVGQCPIRAGLLPERLVTEDGRAVCLGFKGDAGIAPRCSLTGDMFANG